MNQALMAALLAELRELEIAQAVIDARADLKQSFTWSCVVIAIRERRQKLLTDAETLLGETVRPDGELATAPHALTDVLPPGRVH